MTPAERSARWRARDPEKAKASYARYRAQHREKAKAATTRWRTKNPKKFKAARARYYTENKDLIKAKRDDHRRRHPERNLLWSARFRAKKAGIPFSITEENITIPEVCPVFGTPFVKKTMTAATLDRSIPSLGYVPGNVQVISRRANLIKQDATPEEIEKVAEWLRRILYFRPGIA